MAFIALKNGCRWTSRLAMSRFHSARIQPRLWQQSVAEKCTFADLGIEPSIVEELAKHQITTPTKVQEMAIPTVLESMNTYICDQTGTGKTLCYLLPLLNSLVRDASTVRPPAHGSVPAPGKQLKGLVVAANALLASQICEVFNVLGQPFGASASLLLPYSRLRVLPHTKLMVTTLDSLGRHELSSLCDDLDLLVLDNFVSQEIEDTSKLYQELDVILPATNWMRVKRTKFPKVVVVGATLHPRGSGSGRLFSWMKKFSQNRVAKVVPHDSAFHLPPNLDLVFRQFRKDAKMQVLVQALRVLGVGCGTSPPRVLIHCKDDEEVGQVASALDSVAEWYKEEDSKLDGQPFWWRFHCSSILSLTSPERHASGRNAVLKFQSGESSVLVCQGVDVVGVDVPDVSAVVLMQFDSLRYIEDFLDMSGRTARVGKPGSVICLTSLHKQSQSSMAQVITNVTAHDVHASFTLASFRFKGTDMEARARNWQRILGRITESAEGDNVLRSLDEYLEKNKDVVT